MNDSATPVFFIGIIIGAVIGFIVTLTVAAIPQIRSIEARDEWAQTYFKAPGQEVYFDLDKKAYIYKSLVTESRIDQK